MIDVAARVTQTRRSLEQRKGKAELLRKQLEKGKLEETTLDKLRGDIEIARHILQEVAQATQQELEIQISGLVTAALAAVFPDDPYEFVLRFTPRRGRTEADLLFRRNGEEIEPLTASGGGAVDVAAFALRVALWRISRPVTRATIVLDEPFRFLSADLRPRAAELLQMLSERLNLQFVLVTHADELVDAADKVFRVSQKNGVSFVKGESVDNV